MGDLATELAAAVRNWPVGSASVAVVGRDGPIAVHDDGVEHPWASVTKLVSALAVLDACADGLLGLDSPGGPPGATLRHLLSHSSGIAMDSENVLAAPGTRRIYSNRGIELAVDLAAGAAGQSAGDLLTERVLEPLGMSGARLDGSPAHGMRSGIDDLVALGTELLDSTALLPSVVTGLSSTVFPGLPGVLPGFGRQQHNDWGLGAEIKSDKTPHWTSPQNSLATFGHFGQSGSFLWVDPDAGLACMSLSDKPFGEWAAQAWPAVSTLVLERAGG